MFVARRWVMWFGVVLSSAGWLLARCSLSLCLFLAASHQETLSCEKSWIAFSIMRPKFLPALDLDRCKVFVFMTRRTLSAS